MNPQSHSNLIQQSMKLTLDSMLIHQQNGQYLQAQKCRVKFQHQKQQYKQLQINQMRKRHRAKINDLNLKFKQELNFLNKKWTDTIIKFNQEAKLNICKMGERHQAERQHLRQKLDSQLQTKVKQSVELINLRKMEEHLANQKNYPQAHLVQQKINLIYRSERTQWIDKRSSNINLALNTLRNKQNVELQNQRHRIKIDEEDNVKNFNMEKISLQQKYQNRLNDLSSQQQRELLSFRGEFKTLGGATSQFTDSDYRTIKTSLWKTA